jgi:hypothetical protein
LLIGERRPGGRKEKTQQVKTHPASSRDSRETPLATVSDGRRRPQIRRTVGGPGEKAVLTSGSPAWAGTLAAYDNTWTQRLAVNALAAAPNAACVVAGPAWQQIG